jgi:phosphatidate phosphatase APP1
MWGLAPRVLRMVLERSTTDESLRMLRSTTDESLRMLFHRRARKCIATQLVGPYVESERHRTLDYGYCRNILRDPRTVLERSTTDESITRFSHRRARKFIATQLVGTYVRRSINAACGDWQIIASYLLVHCTLGGIF